MLNILTFDIEDWYHANYDTIHIPPEHLKEERVTQPTDKILDLLRITKNKATFFVLGQIAESHPELVRKIADQGHEIASHGYDHQLVYEKGPEAFHDDIQRSKKLLERICGRSIIGYRAPSWSLCRHRTPWAWPILKQAGFKYDSSIFPFKTCLYGDNRISPDIHKIHFQNDALYEIPPSIITLNRLRIPFAGGFYFRLFSYPVVRYGIRRLNLQNKRAVLYLHPREIDVAQPRLTLKKKEAFIHYINIDKTEHKLRRVLNDFQFNGIGHILFASDATATI